MHCWCPPATGPGQPHLSSCSHFKRPAQAFIGSYHDWDLTDPVDNTTLPEYMWKIDPEAWTFGKMAAKLIEDATAAESETGQISSAQISKLKTESISLTEAQYNHAYQYAAQQWLDIQKPQAYVHSGVPEIGSNNLCTCGGSSEPFTLSPAHAYFCPLNEPCTCDHRFGATPHAHFCPLGDGGPIEDTGDAAVTVAKFGPGAK
jgi:hypothetical protein